MVHDEFGLYIHIPFCRQICHYCDFAKTARFDEALVDAYFEQLHAMLQGMLSQSTSPYLGLDKFSSVYFGGGTPSLFPDHIARFLKHCESHVKPGAEITLEVNPEDINPDSIVRLRETRINRLSLGVQTFDEAGLKILTREHSAKMAHDAVDLCQKYFDQVNIDLMFGWQGQTAERFQSDLDIVIAKKLPHVSVYALTYEGHTVFAKRQRRGVAIVMPEELEERLYHMAREHFQVDYDHEEVSNFARPGFHARHNHLYWTDKPYLGIGVGAHGYLKPDDEHPQGLRYGVTRNLKQFLSDADAPTSSDSTSGSLAELLQNLSKFRCEIDERTPADWATELIWTGLRTPAGVDLSQIELIHGSEFRPTPRIRQGVEEGCILIDDGRILRLSASEWFRESAWALEVDRCFELNPNSHG